MLSDAARQDAMRVLQRSAPMQSVDEKRDFSDAGACGKGTSDIKSVIESFHANNVFVAPPKKAPVLSEADRKTLNSIAIQGLQKLYGGK